MNSSCEERVSVLLHEQRNQNITPAIEDNSFKDITQNCEKNPESLQKNSKEPGKFAKNSKEPGKFAGFAELTRKLCKKIRKNPETLQVLKN